MSASFAEIAVITNFSFLRGASHPGEMVARADALGLAAIGIADRNSFAGVVRAYGEWKKRKTIKLVVGTRLVTVDGFEVLTYPTDRQAYGRLCQLLTQGNLKAKKGECHLTFEQIADAGEGQIFIALPPPALFARPHPAASRPPLAPPIPSAIAATTSRRGSGNSGPKTAPAKSSLRSRGPVSEAKPTLALTAGDPSAIAAIPATMRGCWRQPA